MDNPKISQVTNGNIIHTNLSLNPIITSTLSSNTILVWYYALVRNIYQLAGAGGEDWLFYE
jgi:hypothetical protein